MKDMRLFFLGMIPIMGFALLISCSTSKEVRLEISNELQFARSEIVAIKRQQLAGLLRNNKEADLRIKRQDAGYIPLQWIDYDQDGIAEELLFQADVAATSSETFTVLPDAAAIVPMPKSAAYSRFVPERTDDYTWENDKVAFRTYGPDAQQRAEQKRENGTLSSGIDLWFKKTSQPVIDKWYAGYKTNPNFYHTDHGEGYDPYHVGASRGTGGSGVWENDSLYVSKNFTTYKTIASGPLRTIFELAYAPWSKYAIRETKRISLDLGSNFSKFEIALNAERQPPNYTLGITLHKKEGQTNINQKQGWFSHWESIDGAFVGEGIVLDPLLVASAFAHKPNTPDQSNLLVVTKPLDQKIVYYAGFAWEKSGQVASAADWEILLEKQSQVIAHPLKTTIK